MLKRHDHKPDTALKRGCHGWDTAVKSRFSCTALRPNTATASFSSSRDSPCKSSRAKIPARLSLAEMSVRTAASSDILIALSRSARSSAFGEMADAPAVAGAIVVVVLRRLGPCENAQSTVIVLPSNSNLQQKNVQRNCSAAGQRRLRETDPLAPSMASCASYGFFQAKSGRGGGGGDNTETCLVSYSTKAYPFIRPVLRSIGIFTEKDKVSCALRTYK